MMDLILKALYFFLPAYFANMAPLFFGKIKSLRIPISPKLFGSHKTWGGLVIGTLVGGGIFWIQKELFLSRFKELTLIDYADFSLALGFFLGGGALIGDLVKSYYKRKAGIKPGQPWIPWDQLDFVIGGLTLGLFIYVPTISVVVILLLLSPILHLIFNLLGYWFGLKKSKI